MRYVGGGTAPAIPAAATAVTGNLTVVNETAAGVVALGPTMTATLNWIEFSAMAFGMSSFSTRVGISAW